MSKKQRVALVALLLLLATFLRFYRLYETAPFLGDQGRDLLEIRESLLSGKIPLSGPPTSLNFKTGPAHYYLLLPSLLLTHYHPIGPIIFSTFLGVIVTGLIFYLSLRLFGFWPALVASLAHAGSPLLIEQTRGIWNPIDIPLFCILVFICLCQIQEAGKLPWFLALGFFAGILAQLHPSTLPVVLFVFLWWLYFFFKKVSKNKRALAIKWSIGSVLAFLFSLFPYLIFQIQNRFSDLRGSFWLLEGKFSLSPAATESQNWLSDFFKLFNSLFDFVFPIPFMGLVVIVLPFFGPKKQNLFWHRLFSLWVIGNLLLLASFPGPAPLHYTASCWILPFLLLASCLKAIRRQKITFLIGLALIAFNLTNYPNVLKPTNDLAQAEKISQMILEKAKNQSFAILLISDRSASDTHLRYFLKIKGANVLSLKEKDVPSLFLICIEPDCPTTQEVQNFKLVESECLPWCPPLQEEKEVDLAQWRFISNESTSEFQIYLFSRKP